MSASTKTDNHNPAAKLELRRRFLRIYHADGKASVMDCFQGGAKLWGKLRSEFTLANYWGVDVKPRKGRLKLDSARILEQSGWTANVIDLDAYGSPWRHFQFVCENAPHSLTVFITIGMVRIGGGNFDRSVLQMVGANFRKIKMPNSLGVRLSEHALAHAVALAGSHGLQMTDIFEAFPQQNARYLGFRLEKLPVPSKAARKARV